VIDRILEGDNEVIDLTQDDEVIDRILKGDDEVIDLTLESD
jgi:hypothetical protein